AGHGGEGFRVVVDEKKVPLRSLPGDAFDDAGEAIDVDGLHEVVLDLEGEGVLLLGHDGDHDDGDGAGRGRLLEAAQHLPAVHAAGHDDVEGDGVGTVLLGETQAGA